MARTKNQSFLDAHRLVMQLGLALHGRTQGPCSLSGEGFDEAAYARTYGELRFFVSIHRTLKLQLLYLFGEHRAAVRMGEASEAVAPSTAGMIWDAWRCVYRALSLAACACSREGEAREAWLRDLEPLIERMRLWSESCPESFDHRYALVQAETAAARGDTGTALDAYERAIREAAEQGFAQVEALANECCARF